jgi:hypothetical protein
MESLIYNAAVLTLSLCLVSRAIVYGMVVETTDVRSDKINLLMCGFMIASVLVARYL